LTKNKSDIGLAKMTPGEALLRLTKMGEEGNEAKEKNFLHDDMNSSPDFKQDLKRAKS
jgi:hypothetical protein